jgi:hypothetical protein
MVFQVEWVSFAHDFNNKMRERERARERDIALASFVKLFAYLFMAA